MLPKGRLCKFFLHHIEISLKWTKARTLVNVMLQHPAAPMLACRLCY